jgi:oxazoline/thiazoline dehydrogenase
MMSERKQTDIPIQPAIKGTSLSVKLRDDVTVEREGNGQISLSRNRRKFPEMAGIPLIESLAHDWMTEAAIDGLAESSADPATLYFLCERLFYLDLLQARCSVDGQPLFSLVPSPHWQAWQEKLPESSGRLSRSACFRPEGHGFVLEMPLSQRKCIIHDEKCLVRLMEIVRGDAFPVFKDEALATFYRALRLMGAMEQDEPTRDAVWEFHDLMFFHHSSMGFHDDPTGATWRLKNKFPPAPLFKPAAGEYVPLPEPDHRLMEKLSAPFAEVLAHRRSGRIPGHRPITIEELGALLHASARVEYIRDDPDLPCSISFRPSPSGGALHSLEIYLLVSQCTGLSAGAWRYDPDQHLLEAVGAGKSLLDAYLKSNPHTMAEGAGLPNVRLVVTSRFLRESWKYEKIAYRLVLQDLGCLYQTLSLTAEALGLASCILGTVDAKRLGAILNLEPLAEPVIGEMTLSSKKVTS